MEELNRLDDDRKRALKDPVGYQLALDDLDKQFEPEPINIEDSPTTPKFYFKEQFQEVLSIIIRNTQMSQWGEEYTLLKEGKSVPYSSELYQLRPFMEKGLIKMRTRLEYSLILPEQLRFPVIIPKETRLAILLILHEHKVEHIFGTHCGPEQVRRNLRNQYWVMGGRRYITKVLKMCKNRECRNLELLTQIPPSL